MQRDDTANPGMLSVLDGEALWRQPAGPDRRSCADCHGDAAATMRGVAARYPAYSPAQQRPITSRSASICAGPASRRPRPCRGRAPTCSASRPMSRTSRAACRSRPATTSAAGPSSTRDVSLFAQRQGQLNLSCAACHDDNRGGRLAGNPIPQGHPTGYPLYRLEWQSTRLAAAAPAQLHDGRARRAIRLRLAGIGRSRALSHVARARAAARDAGRAAMSQCDPFDAETEQVSERLKLTCRFSPRGAGAL